MTWMQNIVYSRALILKLDLSQGGGGRDDDQFFLKNISLLNMLCNHAISLSCGIFSFWHVQLTNHSKLEIFTELYTHHPQSLLIDNGE